MPFHHRMQTDESPRWCTKKYIPYFKVVILIFVLLFFCFTKYCNAEHPLEPAAPELEPAASEQLGEIFFASGTVSGDGKYLYVIFDRFLLQYVLPSLTKKCHVFQRSPTLRASDYHVL